MTRRIGVIVGTTRPGRFADHPARWIAEAIDAVPQLTAEIVDLRDYPLAFFDAPQSPSVLPPTGAFCREWSVKMAGFDGYVFITAEYNRTISAVLKNALDHLYDELRMKPAGFVGYGGVGGARAVEHLRQILIEFQMVPLRHAVHVGIDPYLAVANGTASLSQFDYLVQVAKRMLHELQQWLAVTAPAERTEDAR